MLDDSNIDDLMRQADQMMATMHGDSDLPRVNRSLQQMRQFSEHLCARGPPSQDANAARLLGSRGYELPGPLSQKLEALSTLKTYESLEPYADTDIALFLKNERENALLAAVEQTRRQTFMESERRCLRAVQEWWDKEKQQVLSTLANAGSLPGTGDLPDSLAPQSFVGSRPENFAIGGGIRTTMSQMEMAYARQVDLYHSESLGLRGFGSSSLSPTSKSGHKDFCSRLYAFIQQQQPGDNHPGGFVEFWKLIDRLSDLPRVVGVKTLMEARSSVKLQKAGVRRALNYLESEFIDFMQAAVSANPREARLGGVPGTRSYVRALISLRPPQVGFSELQDGLVDGKPVWAMIYLCMRSGDLVEALQVAKDAANNLGDFIPLFEEYVSGDRVLPSASRAALLTRYKRHVRSGSDPFKRAVYCVIGGCEPSENHPEVASSIDDFLWLKLTQLQWSAEESALSDDSLTLGRLQRMLLEEYGEAHFEADQQPQLYFKVLFLTLQFESAIAFLSRFEALRCHAVHAALALHDRRILLLPDNPQAQLLSSDSNEDTLTRRLNLARLVMIYTRKFEVTDPREALNYYFFLRDLKIASDNLFYECVAQLAVDSKEVELLFGRLDEAGVRKPGAIDKFGVDVSQLLVRVAHLLEARGLSFEAVSVFDLSGQLEEAVRLLNQMLTEVVSQPPDDVARRQLKEMGSRLAFRLRSGDSVPGDAILFHLLDLLTFFDLAHTAQAESALAVIDAMRLLPASEAAVEARLHAFDGLPEEVRRVTPRLLVAVMRCLVEKRRLSRASGDTLGSPTAVLNELRGRSKALLVYAGRLPYRMPGDVYSQLTQMEIEMGCQ